MHCCCVKLCTVDYAIILTFPILQDKLHTFAFFGIFVFVFTIIALQLRGTVIIYEKIAFIDTMQID